MEIERLVSGKSSKMDKGKEERKEVSNSCSRSFADVDASARLLSCETNG